MALRDEEYLECVECGTPYTKNPDRALYQGAYYDDVRNAVYMIVRHMRSEKGNMGYNTTWKRTDLFMNFPEVIRLYEPYTSVYNGKCEAVDHVNKKRCGLSSHKDNIHEFTNDMT